MLMIDAEVKAVFNMPHKIHKFSSEPHPHQDTFIGYCCHRGSCTSYALQVSCLSWGVFFAWRAGSACSCELSHKRGYDGDHGSQTPASAA